MSEELTVTTTIKDGNHNQRLQDIKKLLEHYKRSMDQNSKFDIMHSPDINFRDLFMNDNIGLGGEINYERDAEGNWFMITLDGKKFKIMDSDDDICEILKHTV